MRGCKRCGRPGQIRKTLSATGLCRPCGAQIAAENLTQLVAHDGPYFDHWRRRCLAAFGIVQVDEHSEAA